MKIVRIESLLSSINRTKKGTLREAFPGEEPDFVQERDKECTGMTFVRGDGTGFSVTFAVSIPLEAGVGYVFEEQP